MRTVRRLAWFVADHPVSAAAVALGIALAWTATASGSARLAAWSLDVPAVATGLAAPGRPGLVGTAFRALALLLALAALPRIERLGGSAAVLRVVVLASGATLASEIALDGALTAGSAGVLAGAAAWIAAGSYRRAEGWRAAYHHPDGHLASVVLMGATVLEAAHGGCGLAAGFLVGGLAGVLGPGAAELAPLRTRRAGLRALSAAVLGAVALSLWCPWVEGWHLVRAELADTQAARLAVLEGGVAWCPASAALHARLASATTDPARALDHRARSLALAPQVSGADAAWVALARAFAAAGAPGRARDALRRVDAFRLAEADAVELLVLASALESPPETLATAARWIARRHAGRAVGAFATVALEGDPARRRLLARRMLEVGSVPPALLARAEAWARE